MHVWFYNQIPGTWGKISEGFGLCWLYTPLLKMDLMKKKMEKKMKFTKVVLNNHFDGFFLPNLQNYKILISFSRQWSLYSSFLSLNNHNFRIIMFAKYFLGREVMQTLVVGRLYCDKMVNTMYCQFSTI